LRTAGSLPYTLLASSAVHLLLVRTRDAISNGLPLRKVVVA